MSLSPVSRSASFSNEMIRLQLLLRAEHLPPPPPPPSRQSSSSSWLKLMSQRTTTPNAFAVISDVSNIGSVMGITKRKLGVTEVVPQTESPEFATVLIIPHRPGTEHYIAIDVFHHDRNRPDGANEQQQQQQQQTKSESSSTTQQQLCGIIVDVETILSSRDACMTELLPGTNNSGKLVMRLEPCLHRTAKQSQQQQQQSVLKLHVRGYQLQRSSDVTYRYELELRRKQQGKTQDSFCLVHRLTTCAEASTRHPVWDPVVLNLETLCNCNVQRELQLVVVGRQRNKKRQVVGWCRTTVQGLVEAQAVQGNCDLTKAFALNKGGAYKYDDKNVKKRQGKLIVLHAELGAASVGVVAFAGGGSQPPSPQRTMPVVRVLPPPSPSSSISTASSRRPSFHDYIKPDSPSSLFLQLCVAIDFTKSNWDHRVAGTPHFVTSDDGDELNDYEWCMTQIGLFVGQYSTTKDYPVWGFGATFGDGKQYDIFQVGPAATARGVEGLSRHYRQAILETALELGSETRYDRVIQAAAHHSKKQLDQAQSQQGGLSYTILLILTTGTEQDVLAARDTIESVHAAPLSIVFVRIDNGTTTDSVWEDCKLNTMLGHKGLRPCCTFLEGKRYRRNDNDRLVEECRSSFGPQLVQYFSSRGIHPR